MPTNLLSCEYCRSHKIKCDKEEPSCGRCASGNLDCRYPRRRPRTVKPSKQQQALDAVLERLRRLEQEQIVSKISHLSWGQSLLFPSIEAASPQGHISDVQHNADRASVNSLHVPGSFAPHRVAERPINPSNNTDCLIECPSTGYEVLDPINRMIKTNSEMILRRFDGVNTSTMDFREIKRKLSDITAINAMQIVTTDSHIPFLYSSEQASAWIQCVYDNMADDFFFGLLDWKLIRSIPHIINSKHVRLDATMTLLFKLVLHFGWLLTTEDHPNRVAVILRGMYTDCCSLQLASRVEQPEASFEALVIAISLTWMGIANCDYWGSYSYHQQACKVACELGLAQLDASRHTVDDVFLENKRKGFWQLLHIDFSFILLLKQQPSIPEFKVNLPSLKQDTATAGSVLDDAINRAGFLVTSRLALLIVEFSQLSTKYPCGGPPELDNEVEGIIREIQHTLAEWKIEDLLIYTSALKLARWLLPDLIINCHVSVMVIRETWYRERLDRAGDEHLQVSRKILGLFSDLLTARVRLNIISLNLTAPSLAMSFFTIYGKVLRQLDKPQALWNEDELMDKQLLLDLDSSAPDDNNVRSTHFVTMISHFGTLVRALKFL